jgi:hypothetical protein
LYITRPKYLQIYVNLEKSGTIIMERREQRFS